MLRNDITDGLLVWMNGVESDDPPLLVLDREKDQFTVSILPITGDNYNTTRFDNLKSALENFMLRMDAYHLEGSSQCPAIS